MYLAEISPAAERGFHLAAQELACVLGCAASAAAGPPLRLAKLAKLGFFLQNFANSCRARSRLYQNENLQENMRLTAFFKL